LGGLKDNDIILEIDGNKVESIMDVSKYITTSTGDVIDFKVERFDQEYLLRIKPNIVLSDDNLGNKVNKRMVGIKLGAVNNKINHVKLGPAQALIQSVKEVYFVSTSSLKYIGTMLTGSGDSSQLGGPIRIAKITGQVAEIGILPFISIMAYISISLGLINLFPIPMLDGGHLMFYAFEKGFRSSFISENTRRFFSNRYVFVAIIDVFYNI
jgi:regulator of sigma E protease